MKIVIISQNCFPSLGPRQHRTTELAKEFARRGHNVIIYALLGNYNYSKFSMETGITFKKLGKSRFGIEDNIGFYNRNIIYRGFVKYFGKYFEFPAIELIPMVKKSLKKERQIDLLITVAVPHPIHWGAANYVKKNRSNVKLWVADCGDPFMKSPFGFHPPYFKPIEKKWGNLCDYITVPIPAAKDGYYEEFRNKIRVIPQGFSFSDINLARYQENPIPTFAYSGFLYKGKRDITKFLEYITEMRRDFKFVVYSQCITFFEPFKEKLGEKLEIREYVPRKELLFELSKMDFVINIANDSSVQVPSKLIDYALTKRPILEISSNFNEDKAFEDFLKGDYTKRKQVKDLETYDIWNVANSFLELKRLLEY